MFASLNRFILSRLLILPSTALLLFLWLAGWPLPSARMQGNFSSGSTGADGAFNPTTNQTIPLPANGIFNYSTVNIPANVTITYTRNAANTPVTILATGNVVINGVIQVSGKEATSRFAGGIGGPGGFNGGHGAFGFSNGYQGANGEGPGGGNGGKWVDNNNAGNGGGGGFALSGENGSQTLGSQGMGIGGMSYGSPTLIPLIGGAGGGGRWAGPGASSVGTSGGGGGGAILIASSGTISGNGAIYANGGNGLSFCCWVCSGGGSGGAIRLVANFITGSIGTQVINGITGCGSGGGSGGAGYVRIEAYDLSGYNPNVQPGNAVVSVSTPKAAILSNLPQLRITSVAGVTAPSNPAGTLNSTPDITIPTAQANPVTVALAANNIPTGTVVQVKVTPEPGTATTVQSTPLSGTQASSTATASVTLPTTGVSLISATTTIDLALMSYLKPIFIEGEKVRKMEISAVFGRQSEISYITESGKRIKRTSEQ